MCLWAMGGQRVLWGKEILSFCRLLAKLVIGTDRRNRMGGLYYYVLCNDLLQIIYAIPIPAGTAD